MGSIEFSLNEAELNMTYGATIWFEDVKPLTKFVALTLR